MCVCVCIHAYLHNSAGQSHYLSLLHPFHATTGAKTHHFLTRNWKVHTHVAGHKQTSAVQTQTHILGSQAFAACSAPHHCLCPLPLLQPHQSEKKVCIVYCASPQNNVTHAHTYTHMYTHKHLKNKCKHIYAHMRAHKITHPHLHMSHVIHMHIGRVHTYITDHAARTHISHKYKHTDAHTRACTVTHPTHFSRN